MSSIKDEETSKNSSHEEPDLENQLSQETNQEKQDTKNQEELFISGSRIKWAF